MSYKSTTVIPPVFKFQNSLGVKGRSLKVAFFIPNNFNDPDMHSTEVVIGRMKFFDLVGFFTSEKGYQIARHRMRKIFDWYNKGEIDLLTCKSKSDLARYENTIDSNEKSILKSGIPIYCVKDCILIKDSKIIYLS